jgi:hypothetical protein
MGSFEPVNFFTPEKAFLDTQTLHVKTNEIAVRRILDELHTKHQGINVESAIRELIKFIDTTDTLDEESRATAQKNFAKLVVELGDQMVKDTNFSWHGLGWNYKTEIAYLWEEAKSRSNEHGLAATISKIHACHWGQLINLCHTAEAPEASFAKQDTYVLDFDGIILNHAAKDGNDGELSKFSNKVYKKLQDLNIPNLSLILKNWAQNHNNNEITPARMFVDGYFNQVLAELVREEKGNLFQYILLIIINGSHLCNI